MYNLTLIRISQLKYIFTENFISFLLGLILKQNREFKNIHYLSFFYRALINNYIIAKFLTLFYSLMKNIFARIVTIEKHAIFIKQDIKDLFCNIFVVSQI